jgi:hypothetical protein
VDDTTNHQMASVVPTHDPTAAFIGVESATTEQAASDISTVDPLSKQ